MMVFQRITGLVCLVTMLFTSVIACNGSGEKISPGEVGDGRFQNIVEQSVKNHNLPALTVIVTEDAQVVESAAVGRRSFASSTPVTENDQWQLGSLTKGVTATLAARLVELGFITWDTTIADSFPEYVDQIDPENNAITLADLLRHRSGLARELEPSESEKTNSDRFEYSIRALKNAPRNSRGSFEYSNLGYTIAGLMLGQATGLSWEDSLQQYLFTPLDITDYGFSFPDPGDDLSQPIGHLRRTDQSGERVNDYWIPLPPDAAAYRETLLLKAPAGGVYLSKQDYVKYQYLHLNGPAGESEILTAESFDYLHNPPDGEDYAMGWRVMDANVLENFNLSSSERVLAHGGNVGSWGAQSVILPERKVSVFIASNSAGTSTLGTVAEDLLKIIFKRLQITE